MPVDHTHNIVEIKNVSFAYGENQILKNVSLNIHTGDYLGVIGPNGGGKTTLIKLVLGILKPNAGTINICGKQLSEFHDWAKVGYVAQKATNIDQAFPATVKEVVEMGRIGQKGLGKRLTHEDKDVVDKALVQVEMSEYRDRLIGNLSGGQQQRVFIARALAQQPEIIFLDEPTSGVDQQSQEQFYKLLKKLNGEMEITLVLISHDIDVVTNEVTEVACINHGLVYYGNVKEFVKEEQKSKLYAEGVKFISHG